MTTQAHLPILDIKDNLVLLKDGSAAIVLQTTAVNFALLTEVEQAAIIGAFAQTLNSLSFPIQIVIRSKRLDITSYLGLLDKAISTQANPLLSNLMGQYRMFVQSLIRQNEVLEKHFFVVIPLSKIELGFLPQQKEESFKRAAVMLGPKQEQIVRQLSRIGLKTTQLNTKALIELFYDIYNPPQDIREEVPTFVPPKPMQQPVQPVVVVKPVTPPVAPTPPEPVIQTRPNRNHPFVVEELVDTI
jgi:hypothetical protein